MLATGISVNKDGLLLDAISIGGLCASAYCVTTRNCVYLQLSTGTGKNIDAATSMAVDAPECNIHLLTDADKTGRSAMRFTAKLCQSTGCDRQNGPKCHAFCCLTSGNAAGAAG